MVFLPIDTAQLTLMNKLERTIYLYTQFEECYKCPFLPKPSQVKGGDTIIKKFHTYYTLQYQVTTYDNADNKSRVLCSSTINAQDQSSHLLQITESFKCVLETLDSGRTNIWPLIIAIILLILLAALFFGGKYFYRRWKDETSTNDELDNKISQRLNSLDAFRGLTILLMIFVNWGAGEYRFLDHAEWDGLRFADFIFPAFIFIMGVTMAISLKNLVIKKDVPLLKAYLQVILRSIKLFLVGLVLNSRAGGGLKYLRIPGVLQRFAITYLIVGSVHILSLHLNKDELYSRISYLNDIVPYWPDWILASIMIILYFSLTFGWKFDSDCPRAYTGPGGMYDEQSHPYCVGGAANKIDKAIFGENHIYQYFTAANLYDPIIDDRRQFNLKHDPEGLLGVTNSIILAIIGLQMGKIILTYSSAKQRFIRWAIWALSLGVLTAILAGTGAVPINKNLWSFTFVCATGTASIIIFAIFYLLIDLLKIWPLGKPFHYPGMNSILLYIGHDFTGGMLPFAFVADCDSHVWPLTQNIIGVLLWLLISVYLAKKNFFLTL